jgi:GNAT superfamily N-acetyltransferase
MLTNLGNTTGAQAAAPEPEEELIVRQSVEPADLRRLLDSLFHEDCAHSWRNFGPAGTLEQLLAWENQRRPTQLFFFYVRRGSELRILAASAVADKLNRDFPHPGFCVLGRCYIMPEFRGQGFYRRILHYRLEYCRARFANALNGIHIGSVSERITAAITHHGLPDWPPFIHIGEEELPVAGEVKTVSDYLLLLPEYVHRLQRALTGPRAPACVIELRRTLGTLETGGVRNFGLFIKSRFEEARSNGWFADHEVAGLEQLLLFCARIPLVGFDQRHSQGGHA